jgi:hypothetical protein
MATLKPIGILINIDISDTFFVMSPSDSEAELFDLSGRKLNAQPVKGVYIQNGKKVVR